MTRDDLQDQLVRLGNGAHALALQLLGNRDDAADAVHEAFAKVLRKPAAYDARRGPLAPWFLRLVRNHCLDLLRQRRAGASGLEELPDPAPGPELALQRAQRDQALHAALRRLGADQRQIVILRDFMDLTYADIAAVLEVPAGTVMSRLHRARTALKEELAQHEHE